MYSVAETITFIPDGTPTFWQRLIVYFGRWLVKFDWYNAAECWGDNIQCLHSNLWPVLNQEEMIALLINIDSSLGRTTWISKPCSG